MEQALAAVHQTLGRRDDLTLLIGSHDGMTRLFVRASETLRPVLAGQLYAQYPDVAIDLFPVEILQPAPGTKSFVRKFWLSPYAFPIRRFAQYEDALNRILADPLASLLAAVRPDDQSSCRARVELQLQPAGCRIVCRARRVLLALNRDFFRRHPRLAAWYARSALAPALLLRLTARGSAWLVPSGTQSPRSDLLSVSSARVHEREEDLQAASDKLGRHLFACRLRIVVAVPKERAESAKRKLDEISGAVGQFSVPRLASFRPLSSFRLTGQRRRRAPQFLLSAEEVAGLWHPPTSGVRSPGIAHVASRQLEPPPRLPSPVRNADVAVLGETDFRGRQEVFGVKADDRLRHLAVLGKTGQGKTTLLASLISADVRAGRGLAFLDPHGDAYELLTHYVPRSRTNDLVLFDPAADPTCVPALNLLHCPDPARRPLVASGVVSAFKKVFADSWGPRLQYVLTNAVLALLETPGATLVSLVQLLHDGGYRRSVVGRLRDPAVRAFWMAEFEPLPPRLKAEWVAPVQNKVGALVTSPLLRAVVGQPRSTLDLRRVMDRSHVLLVNLSKGRLGDDASALLGSLLVTAIQLAAMSRANVSEHQRTPFFCYLDEFHSFATDSFSTLFSEGRKYGVGLTVATQFLEQLDEALLASIAGNVGSLIAFQCGQRDAETVAEMLGQPATAADLLQLPKYHAAVRLLIDGHPSAPFSMRTLPLPAPPRDAQDPETLRRTSRHHFARSVPPLFTSTI